MRKIIIPLVLACFVAAACGLNPIRNPIQGPQPPPLPDCYATHVELLHYTSKTQQATLLTGRATYECRYIPRKFRMVFELQTRRPGHVLWRTVPGVRAVAEFNERLGQVPILLHPYLLVIRHVCGVHGPFTAYWRLIQVLSGRSHNAPRPSPVTTVYFPHNDPLEQGTKIRCGI